MDKYTEHDFRRLTPLLSLRTPAVVPQLPCRAQISICEFYFFSKNRRDTGFYFGNTDPSNSSWNNIFSLPTLKAEENKKGA